MGWFMPDSDASLLSQSAFVIASPWTIQGMIIIMILKLIFLCINDKLFIVIIIAAKA